MKKISIVMLSSILLCSIAYAESQPSVSEQPKNTLPDNPSLLRVLTYKTGQGLTKTGEAIQRGAENTSQSIQQDSTRAGEQLEQGSESVAQFAKQKTQQVTSYTKKKVKQGKEAILGTPNHGSVPIEHGHLSHSSTVTEP